MKPQTAAINAVLFVLHSDKPVSLQKIADHLGIKKRTLVFYLTSAMKISLTDFRQKYRMHLAAKMIEVSPKSTMISDISKTLGINEPTTLSRYFKKEFGITPREYQKKHGGSKKLSEKINLSDDLVQKLSKRYFRR